jgi:hypothetical protein
VSKLADESPENQALFYTIKGAVLKSLKKETDAVVYFEVPWGLGVTYIKYLLILQKVLEMHQRLKSTEVHCALFSFEEIGEIRYDPSIVLKLLTRV